MPVFQEVRRRIKDLTVSYSTNEPHITLMALYSDEKNRDEVASYVERVNQKLKPVLIEFRSFGFTEERRGVLRLVAEVKKTDELQKLHEGTVKELSTFIDWNSTPKPEERPTYHCSRLHAEIYKLCGAPYYGELYSPHCTFAVVNPKMTFEKLEECVEGIDLTEIKGNASEVILRQKGPDGIWVPVD